MTERRRGWEGAIGGGLALIIGCGLVQTTGTVGGESHFLGSCGRGCEDGLSCLGPNQFSIGMIRPAYFLSANAPPTPSL